MHTLLNYGADYVPTSGRAFCMRLGEACRSVAGVFRPMKPLIIALVFVNGTALAVEAEVPGQLRASIATPFTGTATIELGGDTLTYTLQNHTGTETATFKPTKEQWKEFRTVLDEIDVWRWRPRYKPRANGGEALWSLDIEYGSRRLHTSGGAAWPDEKGSPRPQPTAAFLKYQRAIEKLVGGRKLL